MFESILKVTHVDYVPIRQHTTSIDINQRYNFLKKIASVLILNLSVSWNKVHHADWVHTKILHQFGFQTKI